MNALPFVAVHGWHRWPLALVLLALVVVGVGCGAVSDEPEPMVEGLVFVEAPLASTPKPLDGSVLVGSVTVFPNPAIVPEEAVVQYYLNDANRSDAPLHVTDQPPYELVLDADALPVGSHELTAFVVRGDDEVVPLAMPARFAVAEESDGDGGGDDGAGGGDDGAGGGDDGAGGGDDGAGGGDDGAGGGGGGGDDGGGGGGFDDPMPTPTLPPREHDGLRQLYVSVTGSDAADGSAGAPLRTIGAALDRAVANRTSGHGTRINVAPGVYRESLIGTFNSAPSPVIVIQASEPGTVTISGSDVWTDWSCSGDRCSKAWPYRWGTDPNPWSAPVGELARRREMVLVNGTNLDQHMSLGALTPGSFFVDESAGRIHVRAPAGVDLNAAVVEVAVRPSLMRLQGMSDFVVRGLRFSHAASEFRSSAVQIVDQNRVVIEDSTFSWNGQTGISFKGRDFTIRNTYMNNNGSSGFSGFKVADVLFEDTESSYNNWRGERAEYRGWNVGHKFVSAHRLTLRRHVSVGNWTRGFWLDVDAARVVIEDSVFCDNRTNGIFVEASQGPITIRDSILCRNVESGLLTSATHRLTLEDNVFFDNGRSAVHISGDFNRSSTDWETGERYTLNNEDWTWLRNVMRASGDNLVISTTHPADRFAALMASSRFASNTYWHASRTEVFQVGGGSRLSFDGWRSRTSQDATSSFRVGGSPP